MSEHIAVSGIIGTIPRRSVTKSGAPITSFRLAAHQSHFDRAKNAWVDDDSSWYSVTTFRQLATNAAASLQKGEHVVVAGRLIIRDWSNAERSGVDVEIVAESVGHDMTWYTTTPVRNTALTRTDAGQAGPPPVESAESVEFGAAADASEEQSAHIDRIGDGFVPLDTSAGPDGYARLDS